MAKEVKFNPYLPEQNKGNYEVAPVYSVDHSKPAFSLSHPYGLEQCTDAIQQGQISRDKAYAKLQDQVRKDKDAMLLLIARDERAYLYAHPDLIKDPTFKEMALKANPKVYDLLTQSDRDDPKLAKTYFESMESKMKRDMIWRNTQGMRFPHRFSELTNPELVFPADRYQDYYKRLLERGPIDRNGVVSKEVMVLAADRALNPHPIQSRDEIERQTMMQYLKKDGNVFQTHDLEVDRNARLLKDALDKRFDGQPEHEEIQKRVSESQKKYWETRKQEMMDLMVKRTAGETLEQEQKDVLQRAQRHLKLTEEERKVIDRKSEERKQLQKTADMRAAQYAAVDMTNTMQGRGQLTMGEANDAIAYVTNGPSVVAAGTAAANEREKITAKVNDGFDDPGLQRTDDGQVIEPYTTKEEAEMLKALRAEIDEAAGYLYEHDGFGHEAIAMGELGDGFAPGEVEQETLDRQEVKNSPPAWALSPELLEEKVPEYNPFK